MALRAVVFDYGMVLTGPPDRTAHAEMVRLTGLNADHLDSIYWADRLAFDSGALTGHAFWRKITQDAGLTMSDSQIEELVHWDVRMWMTENVKQPYSTRGLRRRLAISPLNVKPPN